MPLGNWLWSLSSQLDRLLKGAALAGLAGLAPLASLTFVVSAAFALAAKQGPVLPDSWVMCDSQLAEEEGEVARPFAEGEWDWAGSLSSPPPRNVAASTILGCEGVVWSCSRKAVSNRCPWVIQWRPEDPFSSPPHPAPTKLKSASLLSYAEDGVKC
jgi:hypothetical protein